MLKNTNPQNTQNPQTYRNAENSQKIQTSQILQSKPPKKNTIHKIPDKNGVHKPKNKMPPTFTKQNIHQILSSTEKTSSQTKQNAHNCENNVKLEQIHKIL